MTPVTAAIAIGSNLGAREAHVAFALDAIGSLPGTEIVTRGPVLQTRAVGMPGVEAGGDYLNTVVLVRTTLPARGLLEELHRIERERGRDRAREGRWGARSLDLDLLVYGDLEIDEPGLTVPHPRMQERRFVLEPLAAIAPELDVPGRGRVADMFRALSVGVHAKGVA